MTYNYKNPDRFFCEPLMRYTLTPLACVMLPLVILAVYTGIIGDGGEWAKGTILEWYITGSLISGFLLLIAYTVLYYARGWNNKERWRLKDWIKEEVEKEIAEGRPDHSLRGIIVIFLIVAGMLGFGIYLWYSAADNLDYQKWHTLLTTNQTYVDSFGCDKVESSLNLLHQAVSPRPEQNDMIKQIIIDYEQVGRDKRCDFIIKELKP